MVIFLLEATSWVYLIDRRPKLWIPFFKNQKLGHLITFRWRASRGVQKTKFVTRHAMQKTV